MNRNKCRLCIHEIMWGEDIREHYIRLHDLNDSDKIENLVSYHQGELKLNMEKIQFGWC